MISWPMAFVIVGLGAFAYLMILRTIQYLCVRRLLKEIKEQDQDFYVWSDDE